MIYIVALTCFMLIHADTNPLFLNENYISGVESVDQGADIFYWLFKARNPTQPKPPLMVWLQGGPGASSLYGLFGINGPFTFDFTQSNATIVRRDKSWNNKYDVIYIDQPISVGFSRADDPSIICGTNKCAAEHMAIFLNKFFMKHEEYRFRDFYIFGESYGGSYVPVIAEYIYKQQSPFINLKGIGIGDGWTDPFWQIQTFPYYAYEHKLINEAQFVASSLCIMVTRVLILLGYTDQAEMLMHESDGICFKLIHGYPPVFNPYNINNPVYPPYGDKAVQFLSRDDVKQALHVPNRKYEIYSDKVQTNFEKGDLIKSMSPSLAFLMERIKVMLYTGNLDFICNYLSQEQYVDQLNWSQLSYYKQAQFTDWKLQDGKVAGKVKKYMSFVFLIVFDAGHYVPRDQPDAGLKLIDDFIGDAF